MRRGGSAVALACCVLASAARGQAAAGTAKTPGEVVAGVVKAADRLVASLDDAQRMALLYPFDDKTQRARWSNLPSGVFPRGGLRTGDLSDAQREAVFGLLRATLSEGGVRQVVENMDGDEVLRLDERGAGRRPKFGKDEYFVSILGKPSATEPWMWQFGGHHLAINATIAGDRITLSPSLTGGQPMTYTFNGKQVRQCAAEEDKAFALIAALTPEQLKQAVLGDRPDELRYGPGAEGAKPKDEGIRASMLTEPQRKLLLELISERIGILNETHAKLAMEPIKKDLDRTWFSWRGSTENGKAAGFRIQGPTVLIEYSPQRMGGDATQHVHAMYRDPTNDYGAGMVK